MDAKRAEARQQRSNNHLRNLIVPNQTLPKRSIQIILGAWVVLALTTWALFPAAIIPHPFGVAEALADLVKQGLAQDLLSSLWLNIEAVVLSSVISLALAYATVLPALRPAVAFITKLRFLGLTGLTFVFGLYLGGHDLKVGLLTLGMTVFLTTSMVDVIATIPKDKFDHARTLGMSPWRVVWEVVVLGTMADAFEMVRQNAAISWMMVSMVEGLVRSDGGIGALMLNENRHFKLDAVFALQLVILVIGLGQDAALGLVRRLICPYADLKMERK